MNSWENFNTWLDNLGMFHMRLGLERMYNAFEFLNLKKLPFKTVQIVGTNGKGSTCAFLAALAKNAGLKAGLFSSPHFISPKERITIDGKQIADQIWLDSAAQIFKILGNEPDLTYFEFLTLLALLIFKQEKVDVAFFEAGLGGKNDATTAIQHEVLAFTPIAMDHASIIGPTLKDIAGDKSGAFSLGCTAFSTPQSPVAQKILDQEAQKKHARLNFVTPLQNLPFSSLRGAYQLTNAALALAVWKFLYGEASPEGLKSAFIPGRLQIIPKSDNHGAFILDGGHNPHGILWLTKSLPATPSNIIFSCLGDKDWKTSIMLLCHALPDIPVFIPQLSNDRAANAQKVAAFCNRIFPGRAHRTDTLSESLPLASACNGTTLVTGSLYLLAEFYALYPKYLEADGLNPKK